MKYEVKTEEDGRVVLQLGLNHAAAFDPDVEIDGIVMGVNALVDATIGVSMMDLVKAVIDELEKPAVANDVEPVGEPA